MPGPSGKRNRSGETKARRSHLRQGRPKYLDKLVFDPDKGELSAPNGNDIVVINRQTLGTVFESMRKMLQSGSGLIWYDAGKEAGEAEGRRLKKLMSKMDPERFLHFITDLYTNLGWGRTTLDRLNLEGKSVVIITKNNPLTREVRSSQPVCHYIKGFYQGFCATTFLSDQVTVEETTCEAMGEDRCEFRIRW